MLKFLPVFVVVAFVAFVFGVCLIAEQDQQAKIENCAAGNLYEFYDGEKVCVDGGIVIEDLSMAQYMKMYSEKANQTTK